jgi:hypothetical protein
VAGPEDGVGEGEPPRRGGHYRARQQPLHGDGDRRRWRGPGAGLGFCRPSGSGGAETREAGGGSVGFWEMSGREQQPQRW